MPRISELRTHTISHRVESSGAAPIWPENAAGTQLALSIPIRPKLDSGIGHGWVSNQLVAEPLGLRDDEDGDYPSQAGLQLQTNQADRNGLPHAPYAGVYGQCWAGDAAVTVSNDTETVWTGTMQDGYFSKFGMIVDNQYNNVQGFTYTAATGAFLLPRGVYFVEFRISGTFADGDDVACWFGTNESLGDTTKQVIRHYRAIGSGSLIHCSGIALSIGSGVGEGTRGTTSTFYLTVWHNNGSAVDVSLDFLRIRQLKDVNESYQLA